MRNKIVSIVMLIFAGFVTGCGSKLDSGGLTPLSLVQFQTTPDTTAPTVSTWSPSGTGIALTSPISVRFNERMNQATIDTSTFTVTNSGVAVTGTVAASSSTTFVFTPAAALAYNTTYTVTISSTVTDRAGNPLGANFYWSFTTVDKSTLPVPTLTLGGTFDSAQTVNISYTGPAATVYYTTDGSAPGTSSSSFTGSSLDLGVSVNTTIRAFAAGNPSYYDSAEATETYNIRTSQPVFNYADYSTFPNDTTLTDTDLYHPDGAAIYYTMTTGTTAAPPADPADPDIGSTPFIAGDTIVISGDLTVVKIKAVAILPGMALSQPVMRTYAIDWTQIGTPSLTLDPATGPFDGTQTVQMTHAATPLPQIYYTIDGSDPTDLLNPNRLAYTYGDDITVTDTTTINAYAEGAANGMKDSSVIIGYFVINPTIANVSPNCGSNKDTGLNVTVNGSLFKTGVSVILHRSGETDVTGTVTSFTAGQISCSFDLTGVATMGYRDLVVVNTDGGTATLANGFRIYKLVPDGTVSWWKFDGDATDSVGTNNGSALVGVSYTATADRFISTPKTAHGDGTSGGMIYAPISTELPYGSAARTMMGWFYLDSISITGENFLFGYGQTERFKLFVTTGGRLAFATGILSNNLTGNTVVQSGRWYHAAVTYDGAAITLYLNGMQEGTGYMTLNTASGSYMYFLWLMSNAMTGALDDVMVLDRALTQAEVQEAAASGGYLLPPTNLNPSKGTYADRVVLTWDAVLDADSYTISRSSSLSTGYTTLTSGVTTNSYEDYSVAADTIYYYKVAAENKARSSDYSKAEIGFVGSLSLLTDSFEWGIASWWDISPTQPVLKGSTTATYVSYPLYYGYSCLVVSSPSTSCTGGCGTGESLALTKTFGTPITYFNLSLYYLYSAGANADAGTNFCVYVNNTDPYTYPDIGLVPFKQSLLNGGWWQRTASYMGDVGGINSITLIFYDITNTTEFDVDYLQLRYK